MDLDNDGHWELIIGAIKNAAQDPLVFEIWALKNDEPVMLAQSGSHNRYYLQYAEEDDLWSVAYEAENGAANRAVYYLQLQGGCPIHDEFYVAEPEEPVPGDPDYVWPEDSEIPDWLKPSEGGDGEGENTEPVPGDPGYVWPESGDTTVPTEPAPVVPPVPTEPN